MQFSNVRSVGVIGGGVAGLCAARLLVQEGIACTVFEQHDKLGGVWAAGYSNFGVQVRKSYYQFPDWLLPAETPNFTSGPVIQHYLEDYAKHFNVWPYIRFNASVVAVRKKEDGSNGWTIMAEGQDGRESHDFDAVVVANGLFSDTPKMPTFPGQEDFSGEIMSVAGLQSRDQVKNRKVVVVGFGKSATDAALEAASVAEETSLVFRRTSWPVPQRLAGILPFEWALLNRFTLSTLPLYYKASSLIRAAHFVLRPLTWVYWRLVELLLYLQCRLGSHFGRRVSLVPDFPVETGIVDGTAMVPRPQLYRALRNGSIVPHKAELAGYSKEGVRLSNGKEIDADVVILGTGWEIDHSFLAGETVDAIGKDEDGFYLYRQMVYPSSPGLFFIGAASTFANMTTYCVQARWLADLLAGKHQLPSDDVMLQDIEDMKAWKKGLMPPGPERAARLNLHMMRYHDQLLRDIGARPHRKKGFFAWAWLKEAFMPYLARDYAEVVSGEWRQA